MQKFFLLLLALVAFALAAPRLASDEESVEDAIVREEDPEITRIRRRSVEERGYLHRARHGRKHPWDRSQEFDSFSQEEEPRKIRARRTIRDEEKEAYQISQELSKVYQQHLLHVQEKKLSHSRKRRTIGKGVGVNERHQIGEGIRAQPEIVIDRSDSESNEKIYDAYGNRF
ncbi:unnamed protein product [Caenorhabditis auriculariae]|uniref:Uncharacterized protein n=1 Tax=Caenorhabditis auriculariae TaxID=2777116 RepID=A0A8S1HBH5_9PELO|nr:unnamed protein product [Caenorhabditis auriculariae]